MIIVGTLPGACYAEGMTSYLYVHGIRVFDYPRFAEPLREPFGSGHRKSARQRGLTSIDA
jgi:hypothetical protein